MADPKALIIQTIGIIQKLQGIRQQIIDGHPNFDQIRDSRITTFTNCIVVLDGVYVCFLVRNFELWEDEWWNKMKHSMNGKIRIPTPKNMFVKGFDSFTINAYFSLLFNALENVSLTDGIADLLQQIVNSNQIIQAHKIIDSSYADL
ncbi:MAG: hypothetical protein WA667_21205 [Candidatus Nitrosopolaris sp.]